MRGDSKGIKYRGGNKDKARSGPKYDRADGKTKHIEIFFARCSSLL